MGARWSVGWLTVGLGVSFALHLAFPLWVQFWEFDLFDTPQEVVVVASGSREDLPCAVGDPASSWGYPEPSNIRSRLPLGWLWWAAFGLLALWFDRRAHRRTSPLAVGAAIALVFGSMGLVVALYEVLESGGSGTWDIALFRGTLWMWTVAAVMGLTALPGILRGRRTGLALALCALIQSVLYAGLIGLSLRTDPGPDFFRGVELPLIRHGLQDEPDLDEAGALITLWATDSALPSMIGGNRREVSIVAIESRVPAAQAMRLFAALDREDLWKVQVCAEVAWGKDRLIGRLSVYTRPPDGWPRLDIDLRAGSSGPVLSAADGEPVLERLHDHVVMLRCDPDLPWEQVCWAIDELFNIGANVIVLR